MPKSLSSKILGLLETLGSLNAKRRKNLRRIKLYASTKDSTVPAAYFQGVGEIVFVMRTS